MPSRRFPKPWTVEPIPSGYRVLDANGVVLAQSDGAIAVSDTRLTNDEARRISKLIARLSELVELEKDRNKAKSRRNPQPLRFKPLTIGIREGKLREVRRRHPVVLGLRTMLMRRQEFITLLGGAAAAWPLAAHVTASDAGHRELVSVMTALE